MPWRWIEMSRRAKFLSILSENLGTCAYEMHKFLGVNQSSNHKHLQQGVTKRCRLSWLTNSALVREPKCGGWGVRLRGLSQWESCAHGGQINCEYLTPYLTYDLRYSMSLPKVYIADCNSSIPSQHYLKVQKPYMEMIHNFSSLSIPKRGGSDN